MSGVEGERDRFVEVDGWRDGGVGVGDWDWGCDGGHWGCCVFGGKSDGEGGSKEGESCEECCGEGDELHFEVCCVF